MVKKGYKIYSYFNGGNLNTCTVGNFI